MRRRGWVRKREREEDLDREIRSHLELEAEEQRESGLAPGEAKHAAWRAIGNPTLVKEATREMWTWTTIERFFRDVRYAARALRKDLRFTIAAVVSLALGIGANTAIFTVVNAVLLRPLPYPGSAGLMSIGTSGPGFGNPASYPDVEDWRSQTHTFEGLATYHGGGFILSSQGEPTRILGAVVSSNLTSVLRVSPVLGRGFDARDDEPGARVALLSNSLWSGRFHGDPGIVGKAILLDGSEFTVAGVMPAGFRFPVTSQAEIWVSAAVDQGSSKNQRGYRWLSVIGRLKPGATEAQAKADLDVVARRMAALYPSTNANKATVRLAPELDRIVGGARRPLTLLLAVVGGILLICCANVANLLIARNLARRTEIAVRAALGAGSRTLIAQLLTESMLLAGAGGLCGAALAYWSTQALILLAPGTLPRSSDIAVDAKVLAFAFALSIVTGLLFGLAPALRISKTRLEGHLREARQTSSVGPRHHRLRDALVVAQTALAIMLTAAATLLIASYLRLTHVDPGFDRANILTFDLSLPVPAYTAERQLGFYNDVVARLNATPGVQSAAASWPLPFAGGDPSTGTAIEGRRFPAGSEPVARVHVVTPEYFHSLGMRLISGRDFKESDVAASSQIAIVDEAFARAYFPNESALNKRIQPSISMTAEAPWREIVGIVNSTKEVGLADTFEPQIYLPYAQLSGMQPAMVVKTKADPVAMAPSIRRAVVSVDRNVPVYDFRTMDELSAISVARDSLNTMLFGLFGVLAVVLAAVGIYGVANCAVSQSVREIGIRMALGARARNVVRLALMNTIRNVAAGLAVGLALTIWLSRSMTSLLYEIRPADPAMLALVSVGFALIAMGAAIIPARRAARVDPMIVLRYE